jgi:segregation and condensation protein B
MDTESHPEPETRSAGSIVADLIQDMNAAGQPAAEAKADTDPPDAWKPSDEESSTEDTSTEDTSTEDSAEEDISLEDSAEEDSSVEVSAQEDSAEEKSSVEVSAQEDSAEEGDEPDVLIELDVDPGAIEAILLVVDEPLTSITLATVLDRPAPAVTEALRGLAMAYDAERRGFDLREVAGGWRLYTREEYAEVVEKFVLDGQQAKLTQASLETLAVVAYRQPVSRSRVSAIRGVNCDGVMRTLISRGLIEEAGVEGESGAALYRTTSYFLERLGLNSIDELPDLAPYLPEMDEIEDAIHAESALPPPADDHDDTNDTNDTNDTDTAPVTAGDEPKPPPHQELDEQ